MGFLTWVTSDGCVCIGWRVTSILFLKGGKKSPWWFFPSHFESTIFWVPIYNGIYHFSVLNNTFMYLVICHNQMWTRAREQICINSHFRFMPWFRISAKMTSSIWVEWRVLPFGPCLNVHCYLVRSIKIFKQLGGTCACYCFSQILDWWTRN